MLILNGTNFNELETERYWAFPASYSVEKRRQQVEDILTSNNYIGSRKRDGYYCRVLKDMEGKIYVQSRTRNTKGEFANKATWLPHLTPFFESLPNGTCLLGELYLPQAERSNEVTKLLGCKRETAIKRQENNKLYLYVFDLWAYDGNSLLETQFEDRISLIEKLPESEFVEGAKYFAGEELRQVYYDIIDEGGEGVVITKRDSLPTPGKRPARKTLKLKKELEETLDVIIIGANAPTKTYTGKNIETWEYWLDELTGERLHGRYAIRQFDGEPITPITKSFYHGWAGSLKIGVKRGKEIFQVGSLSGLPQEVLENWKDYLGKVAEITAMEVFETKALRHPKFVQWRPDLSPEDATFEKAFGYK